MLIKIFYLEVAVEVGFANKKLEKECNDDKTRIKKHGPVRAKKLRQRLDDLTDATNLGFMRTLPGRCHELVGDKEGCLALDLDHPYRLIFEPVGVNLHKADGGLDWNKVESVKIKSIEDYHGD